MSFSVLPSGTVTFLFTDIQGSTPLWERAPGAMQVALEVHNTILTAAVRQNGGAIFKFVGDEYQCAFSQPAPALHAALAAQCSLLQQTWGETGPIRVRMGLHTGPAEVLDGDYAVSHTLNRVARIRSAGHGGQILLSMATAELLREQLPVDVRLVDLGEYHLKGLFQPERIFQVAAPGLPADFPPLTAEKTLLHNLPLQLTSFIGRKKEIALIKELLRTSRLVTLTGAGGVGKTRLALEVAGSLYAGAPGKQAAFKHGIWLVELAPVGDPELIPHAIASIFGVHEDQSRTIRMALLDFLSEKELLLLFDNCEHLIAACAELADTILRTCPGVQILASSREALGIEGEVSSYVPSLPSPDPGNLPSIEDIADYEAILLFVERAKQVLPGFALTDRNASTIAQICRRLDGIPLAIELAAARVKVLSLEGIAARLDDRFRLLTGGSRRALPRHQTLRALIDWSYGLLTEAERVLLRSLSVFTGGWTLEAAEALLKDEGGRMKDESDGLLHPSAFRIHPSEILHPSEVLDLLAQLVNKSLVVTDCEGGEVRRYRMLETIRQYAHEKLVDAGEAEMLRDRHLLFFLQSAEKSESDLKSARLLARLGPLDAELDNFRMALGWAFSGGEMARVASGLNLASSLGEYWYIRSLIGEGIEWLEKGLDLLPGEEARWTRARARGCYTAGILTFFTSDLSRYPRARMLLEESISLYKLIGDRRGLALALCLLGACLVGKFALSSRDMTHNDEFQTARSLGEEGLAICRELGDPSDLALALYWNCYISFYGTETSLVMDYLKESLPLFESLENRLYYGFILATMGYYSLSRGDIAAARRYSQACLALAQELKDRTAMAMSSAYAGLAAYYQGDYKQMEADFQVSLEFGRETGNKTWQLFSYRNLGISALRQGQWRKAAGYFLENLSMAQKTAGYEYDLRIFLTCMAGVAAGLGQFRLTARLLGATEVLLENFFKGLDAWDQVEFDRLTASLRASLDDETISAAWKEGRAMTLEQATIDAKALVDW